MQAALDWLFTFHDKNQVLIKNYCRGRHLGFFKNFIFHKTAINFTGISGNKEFLASNRKIIENRVKNKNLEQIFTKFYSFLFLTLICIINYA